MVLPSLFEEQLEHEAMLMDPDLGLGSPVFPEAVAGHMPSLDTYNQGPDRYLELVETAVERLSVPVIASLNGVTDGGWVAYATQLEQAGAAAIELNIYLIAADPSVSGQEIEDQHVRLVEHVRSAVGVPVAVKLGPYFSSPANMCRRLVDAGADGLVLFNRFVQPDIDLDRLTIDTEIPMR